MPLRGKGVNFGRKYLIAMCSRRGEKMPNAELAAHMKAHEKLRGELTYAPRGIEKLKEGDVAGIPYLISGMASIPTSDLPILKQAMAEYAQLR